MKVVCRPSENAVSLIFLRGILMTVERRMHDLYIIDFSYIAAPMLFSVRGNVQYIFSMSSVITPVLFSITYSGIPTTNGA